MHKAVNELHGSPRHAISCISGGRHSAAKGENFPAHRHTNWEFVFYRSGHIQAPIGDLVYQTTPGLLLIVPPNTVHSEIALTDYSNFFVLVDAPADTDWPAAVFDQPALDLQRLFNVLTRELNGRRRSSDVLLASYTVELDVLLRRAKDDIAATEGERLASRAEFLIEERFSSPMRVSEIGRELGCSPSSLRSHFARYRGTSMRNYAQSVRLRHALGLLRSSDQTVETIAQLCGYDSASHLSRHIKKATGHSPGSLRMQSTIKPANHE